VANLSTEGEACRNEADGVINGRWLRALAKGLTKIARRALGSSVLRKGLAYLFVSFLPKSMTNPKPKQAERHAKIMGSGWATVC